MKKYIIIGVILIVVIAGIAASFHSFRVSSRNAKEMAGYSADASAANKNFGKALVVYYSLSGNTLDIAKRIQAKTNADIFEIKTAEEIKTGPSLYLKIKSDLKDGVYPKLADNMPNIKEYDIIFVGSPVWWYTVSTPVRAFLEKADFMGKKVIPFSTQGSNPGTFLEDFTSMAKNAKVTSYMSFNNMGKEYDSAIDNKISVWLNGIEE